MNVYKIVVLLMVQKLQRSPVEGTGSWNPILLQGFIRIQTAVVWPWDFWLPSTGEASKALLSGCPQLCWVDFCFSVESWCFAIFSNSKGSRSTEIFFKSPVGTNLGKNLGSPKWENCWMLGTLRPCFDGETTFIFERSAGGFQVYLSVYDIYIYVST